MNHNDLFWVYVKYLEAEHIQRHFLSVLWVWHATNWHPQLITTRSQQGPKPPVAWQRRFLSDPATLNMFGFSILPRNHSTSVSWTWTHTLQTSYQFQCFSPFFLLAFRMPSLLIFRPALVVCPIMCPLFFWDGENHRNFQCFVTFFHSWLCGLSASNSGVEWRDLCKG